jgi:hypothetical protein
MIHETISRPLILQNNFPTLIFLATLSVLARAIEQLVKFIIDSDKVFLSHYPYLVVFSVQLIFGRSKRVCKRT